MAKTRGKSGTNKLNDMKSKFTITLLAAMASVTSLTATAGEFDKNSVRSENRVETLIKATQESRSAARKTVARKATPGAIITERPEGKGTPYVVEGVSYMLTWSGVGMEEFENTPSEIVDAGNGEVYVFNIIPSAMSKGWVKGTRDGNTITIPLPQVIDEIAFGGEIYRYYADCLKCVDSSYLGFSSFEVDETIDSITMTATEDGGWHLDLPDNGSSILGMTSDEGGDFFWIGYADVISNWKNIPWNMTVVDDDFIFADYACVADGAGVVVGYAKDGDEVFIKGISSRFPDSVVKGSLKDGKVSFDSYQYLGTYIDPADGSMNFGFFLGCEWGLVVDPYDGYEYYGYNPIDAAVFDYDEENNSLTMTEEGAIYITSSLGSLTPLDLYWMPEIYAQASEIDPQPLKPVLEEIGEWDEYWNYGTVGVRISNLNAEGYVLNAADMYYVVELDGVPMESPAILDFADASDLIPFNYIDWNIIAGWDSYREIRIYDANVKDISVYMVYIDADKVRHESPKLDVVYNPTGIESVAVGAGDIRYYDMTGIEIAKPLEGRPYIVKSTDKNGRIVTEKRIR